MNNIIQNDIVEILSDDSIPWSSFSNSTILITGATGLIGNAIVKVLKEANIKYKLDINIIAHSRKIHGDIRQGIFIESSPDYIIHCAAITKSIKMFNNPVDVINVSIDGTRNILELARKTKSKSVLYLSSMEVYGQLEKKEALEEDLGYIDLKNPRSSYPESKRLCELLCTSYCHQYDIPVKIARLAQTFGAGAPVDDNRVFAQFARSAINGEDIVLHTEGNSMGNYCYISDTIRGLLTLLLKGENGEAYNIANPQAATTIRSMAEMVANEICKGKIKVVVKVPDDIKERGYFHDVGFILNIDKIRGLGWSPKYGLRIMYERIIEDWRVRYPL